MDAAQCALYVAVHFCNISLLRLLLAAGANPNNLHIMLEWMKYGLPDMLHWLIRAGADPGMLLHGRCLNDQNNHIVYDPDSKENLMDYATCPNNMMARAMFNLSDCGAKFSNGWSEEYETSRPFPHAASVDFLKGLAAKSFMKAYGRDGYARVLATGTMPPHMLAQLCFPYAHDMDIEIVDGELRLS